MATTQQIHHDDELAMQQFHNADHYQDHDGSPYMESWEIQQVGHVNPVLSKPATTAGPANGGTGVPLSSFLK